MAITVTVTPGKQFAATEKITVPKLNQLGQPTFTVTGTVQTADYADASVTATKMVPGAFFYTASVSFVDPKYTLTGYPATPVLATGLELWFLASNPNVGAVTIDATGVAKKLFKNKTELLTVGDIRTNQVVGMRYESTGDGGSGCWQMISQLGALAGPYYAEGANVTGTANNVTIAIGPAPVAYADLVGKLVVFKQGAAANSGAMQAQVNALALVTMKKFGASDMASGDVKAGQVVVMMYDGTNWQVQNAVAAALTSGSEITIVGATRDLVITNNVSAGLLDVIANDIVVKNAAGQSVKMGIGTGFTINISAGAVGPNGFDAGSATPAWYFVHAIYGSGQANAGILSLSSTTPSFTFAANYTHWALLGAVRCPTGTTISQSYQVNRRVYLPLTSVQPGKLAVANTWDILNDTTVPSLSNFRAAIPPIAKTVSGLYGTQGSASRSIVAAVAACKSDGSVDSTPFGAVDLVAAGGASSIDSFFGAVPFTIPVRGNSAIQYNMQWKSNQLTALNDNFIYVNGYEI